MRALLSIVVCLAISSGTAAAASFDCKKAKTSAEKLICATPELSKADEELAREYKAARQATKNGKALREAQAAWLRNTRNACADAACMLAAYKQRVAELRATARPSGRTGTYEQDDARGANRVYVLEVTPGVLRFEISASWYSDDDAAAGQLCGEVKVEGKMAKFGREETGCALEWTFGKDGRIEIEQNGECDLGNKVLVAGKYKKSGGDAPALEFCHGYAPKIWHAYD